MSEQAGRTGRVLSTLTCGLENDCPRWDALDRQIQVWEWSPDLHASAGCGWFLAYRAEPGAELGRLKLVWETALNVVGTHQAAVNVRVLDLGGSVGTDCVILACRRTAYGETRRDVTDLMPPLKQLWESIDRAAQQSHGHLIPAIDPSEPLPLKLT